MIAEETEVDKYVACLHPGARALGGVDPRCHRQLVITICKRVTFVNPSDNWSLRFFLYQASNSQIFPFQTLPSSSHPATPFFSTHPFVKTKFCALVFSLSGAAPQHPIPYHLTHTPGYLIPHQHHPSPSLPAVWNPYL